MVNETSILFSIQTNAGVIVSSKTSDLSYLVSDALDDAEGCSDAPLVALQQSQAEEAMKSHISTHLGSAERKAPYVFARRAIDL